MIRRQPSRFLLCVFGKGTTGVGLGRARPRSCRQAFENASRLAPEVRRFGPAYGFPLRNATISDSTGTPRVTLTRSTTSNGFNTPASSTASRRSNSSSEFC